MNLTRWMEQWNMFPESGGIILCAVSGGRDSMCLLHYLYELSKTMEFSVAAAHFNHEMRDTADSDQVFVAEFCRERNIPFYVGRGNVYAIAAQSGIGVEETGRRLRYEFLEELAQRINADKIATAHHAGDQAETVLLNLLRGTGPEGLAGIPPVRGKLIRPLLQTNREEMEAYLEKHGIRFVEDQTNEDISYARNRLRLEIWPQLQKINPAVRENIVRASTIIRQENNYLDELARQYLDKSGNKVLCRTLREAPGALRPRILRLLIVQSGLGRKDISAAHLAAMEELAYRKGELNLPGGAMVCCDGTVLEILKREAPLEACEICENAVHWGDFTISCRKKEKNFSQKCDTILLNCDKINRNITVRPWQPKDRLRLDGQRGARSLKRLCVDRGINTIRRDRMPVFCLGERPIAAFGVGVDQEFLPGETGEVIEITVHKEN